MLRFHALLSLAAGGLFAIPALRSQEPQGVLESLAQTVQALEHLGGIEARLAAGEPVDSAEILAATEAPSGTAMERDTFLATLRDEVAGLALQHDRILAGLGAPSFSAGPNSLPTHMSDAQGGLGMGQPGAAQGQAARPAPAPTTGLPESVRRSLFEGPRPLVELPAHVSANPRASRNFEVEGYSADPLREGRLYCRVGRFAEAITILERIDDSPEADYWIAQAYEALERYEEALAGYTALAESESAGSFAARASRDLEFLRWKMDFQSRLGAKRGKEQP